MDRFKFTESYKQEILDTLKAEKIDLTPDEFLSLTYDLQSEIVVFKGELFFEENEPTIGEMRAALRELKTVFEISTDHFLSLDSSSSRLLAKNLPIGLTKSHYSWNHKTRKSELHSSLEDIQSFLETLGTGIDNSIGELASKPGNKGGARKKEAQIRFAAGIADVLHKYPYKKLHPTKTPDGIYERLLSICLRAATGIEKENVHQIALKALKWRDEYNAISEQ